MSIARAPRNTVLAGLFVVVCIALAVVCVIMLSNIRERLTLKSEYIIRFSVADGAEGLDKGAAVKIGGKRVGRVLEVHFTPPEGEPNFVDVLVEIDRRIKLYSDADVALLKPLLGSGSTLNITAGGQPQSGADGPGHPMQPGEMLLGHLGAPGFIAPSDYAKFQSILGRVDTIVADVQPRIGAIMNDAQEAVASVRSITDDARQKWPTWRDQASGVLETIDRERKSFDGLGRSISDGVQQARDLITSGRQIVDENRPTIKEAIDSVREFTVKVNKEAYDKVLAAIADAKTTLESARSAAAQVDRFVTEKSPELSDIITSSALAAQQLKLATTEIRASPWRLLYQPTKKELENELLYNSVRSYANSVSELRYAADALNAVSQRSNTAAGGPNGGSGVDTETLNRLTAKLRAAFDKYQEQERAFLDRWVKTDK